jgi:2'-5' RNA ligase
MGSYAIAYWSMPAGAAHKFFERTIRELAMRFDAPPFEPHLTLFVAPEGSRAPWELLGEVPSPDFVLVAREIGWSERFTETLFVRFERNQRLLRLVEAIRKSSGGSEQYQIDPHLSLIYKKLPAKTKRALAEEIQLPFSEVRFEKIRAMRCKSPTKTADEVREWKLLATQNSTIRKGA